MRMTGQRHAVEPSSCLEVAAEMPGCGTPALLIRASYDASLPVTFDRTNRPQPFRARARPALRRSK